MPKESGSRSGLGVFATPFRCCTLPIFGWCSVNHHDYRDDEAELMMSEFHPVRACISLSRKFQHALGELDNILPWHYDAGSVEVMLTLFIV